MSQMMQPTEAETESAQTGSHVLCNKFLIMLGPTVRISFMEQFGPGSNAYFRSGVSCSHEDAIALYKLLQATLADVERQLEAARGAATKNG